MASNTDTKQHYPLFSVGDDILYGKYKNKKGKIVKFGKDDKGNPTIEIEPISSSGKKKKNVRIGLYKIWKGQKEEDNKETLSLKEVYFKK